MAITRPLTQRTTGKRWRTRSGPVRGRRQTRVAYTFLAPTILMFLVFRHGPAVFSLILSMFDWTMVDDPRFVGLKNFRRLATDEIFWKALWNTVRYTVYAVPPDIIIALFLAVMVNQQLHGMRFFRIAYFIPVVTATAIVAIIWQWMYQPNGIVNGVGGWFGVEPRFWLSDPSTVLPAIAAMAVWKHVGFNMLIFLAGLQSIPGELEEAARLDGASRWRVFVNIKLPLLRPVIVLATILTTIGSFQVFDSAYVMTAGGPFYASTTLVYYTYTKAFTQYQMGYGAAIAFVLFIIVLAVTLLQRAILKGDDDVY
jgi:multiple sugar transport system permease protein